MVVGEETRLAEKLFDEEMDGASSDVPHQQVPGVIVDPSQVTGQEVQQPPAIDASQVTGMQEEPSSTTATSKRGAASAPDDESPEVKRARSPPTAAAGAYSPVRERRTSPIRGGGGSSSLGADPGSPEGRTMTNALDQVVNSPAQQAVDAGAPSVEVLEDVAAAVHRSQVAAETHSSPQKPLRYAYGGESRYVPKTSLPDSARIQRVAVSFGQSER